MSVTREILNSHPVATLKKEISKTNIKGYSKMKKSEIIDLMMANKSRFKHIKMAPGKKRDEAVSKGKDILKKKKEKKDLLKGFEPTVLITTPVKGSNITNTEYKDIVNSIEFNMINTSSKSLAKKLKPINKEARAVKKQLKKLPKAERDDAVASVVRKWLPIEKELYKDAVKRGEIDP